MRRGSELIDAEPGLDLFLVPRELGLRARRLRQRALYLPWNVMEHHRPVQASGDGAGLLGGRLVDYAAFSRQLALHADREAALEVGRASAAAQLRELSNGSVPCFARRPRGCRKSLCAAQRTLAGAPDAPTTGTNAVLCTDDSSVPADWKCGTWSGAPKKFTSS